jgi:hypothetical protein
VDTTLLGLRFIGDKAVTRMVNFVPEVREPQFYDALPEFTMIDAHARMASMRHPRELATAASGQ